VGALINGVPVMPKVHIQENSVEIEIPRVVSLTVWAESSDGVKEQLKSESKIVISQGSELLITGDGFMPQSPMTTSVDDNSNVLGTGTAASAGTISGRYGVSSAAMLGDRVIRFSGISSDGHAVTVAMGVTIIAAAGDSPEVIAQSKAGAQQDFTVAIVLGISAAVFLLLLALYLRRRKQAQD